MARAGDELVNPVTGLRTVFRKTARDTADELLQLDWIGEPGWTTNGEALLSGYIADQVALHGVLAKVRDLNLQLISVTSVDSDQLESSGDCGDEG